MTKGAPELAARDEQIAAAERELEAAQNRCRSRPRQGMSLGQGQVRIDPEAGAHRRDLRLDVDAATMRLEELKQRRAVARAEILGTAWQAAVDGACWRLVAPRSPAGCEKSASVSYSAKTGGPAEMSATCARNRANETDVGAAHDGMEPCRAGLLTNVGGVNR
jgi:hypothetical protein